MGGGSSHMYDLFRRRHFTRDLPLSLIRMSPELLAAARPLYMPHNCKLLSARELPARPGPQSEASRLCLHLENGVSQENTTTGESLALKNPASFC